MLVVHVILPKLSIVIPDGDSVKAKLSGSKFGSLASFASPSFGWQSLDELNSPSNPLIHLVIVFDALRLDGDHLKEWIEL